jgi:RNA polymerase sigma factor for flagellar operon FliA
MADKVVSEALGDGGVAVQFVTRVARSMGRRLGREIPLGDRIAFGMVGYLEAKTRHDPAQEPFPGALAWARTQGAMLDGARRWSQRQSVAALHSRRRRRAFAAGRTLPDRAGGDVVSLDASPPDAGPARTRVPTGRRHWTCDRLREAMDSLPTRERVIVGLHYGEERSIREIASDLGSDRSWISRLHARALWRLKRRMRID